MTSEQVIAPAVLSLQRILFATDFSEASNRALPIAAGLARQHTSQVFLTHIWSAGEYAYMPQGEPERAARGKLVQICRRPEMSDVTCSVLVKRGSPAEAIDRLAREHQIDLVVLGTHARTGVSRALHGSVTEQLFRQLSCPVLTVSPRLDERFAGQTAVIGKILFPTDLSDESRAAFPRIAALAAKYSSEVTLLRVVPGQRRENIVQAERDALLRVLGQQLTPACRVEAAVEFGEVAKSILAFADRYEPDLISFGLARAPVIITNFRPTIAYTVVVGARSPVLTCSKAKSSNL